LENKLQAER